ncbi:MAG: hypothetical protein J6X60_04595 [Ruminiclostridium sp.]|nr:hypothetical protein [Ruminiclostridium sp.]
MQFKGKEYDWKACFDEETGRCTAEYSSGGGNYSLYEITKEIYDSLDEAGSFGDAVSAIIKGRQLYMAVDDRCGPPYTIVFDHDYETLAPWAKVIRSGRVWLDELTDAAVEIFESQKDNREQRRARRAQRESKPDND